MGTMRNYKKDDILFLLLALIIWIISLVFSFGNYNGPIYRIKSTMNVIEAFLFIIDY